MASAGLNKWIVSGNLAADAEVKVVDLRDGEKVQVANATLYVRKPRNRKESFTVSLNIWENSAAWRKLPFLKKGSLIICTGNVEPNPYISSNGNVPRAGLQMSVLDVDLDTIRNGDDEESELQNNVGLEVQEEQVLR
jgi:single-strand DNA-binding protein